MILECLGIEEIEENIGQLQAGAVMATVDAFDRRVERSYYVMTTASSMALHTALGRLHTMRGIYQMLAEDKEKNVVVLERLTASLQHLMEHANKKRLELKEMMELIKQCPTGDDTIS